MSLTMTRWDKFGRNVVEQIVGFGGGKGGVEEAMEKGSMSVIKNDLGHFCSFDTMLEWR